MKKSGKTKTENMQVPKNSYTTDPWIKTVSILLWAKENTKQNHFKLK